MSSIAASCPTPCSPGPRRDRVADSRPLLPAGFLRYWLSAGRGGFTLSGNDTLGPEFYCLCYNGPSPDRDETVGWTAKTSPIPNKPAAFSELKSVDYLQNALCLMDAQAEGKDQGIFVHADGTVCEGPNLNVGIVTEEGIVVVPPFEGCLAGCTMARVMDLIPRYMQLGSSEDIVGVRQVRPARAAPTFPGVYCTWLCVCLYMCDIHGCWAETSCICGASRAVAGWFLNWQTFPWESCRFGALTQGPGLYVPWCPGQRACRSGCNGGVVRWHVLSALPCERERRV